MPDKFRVASEKTVPMTHHDQVLNVMDPGVLPGHCAKVLDIVAH
jgi:hypothetical protein